MKRIDFENHFYDQSLLEAFSNRQQPPFYRKETNVITWTDAITMPQDVILPQLLEVAEKRNQLMKEQGVDIVILSSSPGPEQLDEENSIEVCRKTNDAMAAIMKKYPTQYLGSAILPVKNPVEACKELERCVKEYGFVSWHTHSNYGDGAPDEEFYFPIFQKAQELGVYVYLHPQLPNDMRVEGYGFTVAGPALGFTLDTIITITRMIVSGLFDRLPNLKVVLGHLGEGLPFLLDRMDNRVKFLPNPFIKCKEDVSYYFKNNIYVTTSGNMSKEAFICTKEVLGIDRILFGSDYPYESLPEMMHFLSDVPLTEEEREKLFYRNAIEKLGINLYQHNHHL
ncbi:amidohydrolase family protein [Neobacillus niacini]|uniref:amidohydrolase family protein n=1 Tax=Neobacillus niacini TaxID=86668 RepID=UPI00398352AD